MTSSFVFIILYTGPGDWCSEGFGHLLADTSPPVTSSFSCSCRYITANDVKRAASMLGFKAKKQVFKDMIGTTTH